MTEPYPFFTPAGDFANKRVLVTGGTRGIGAAVVRRFQLAGDRVVATARLASGIIEELNDHHVALQMADNRRVQVVQ